MRQREDHHRILYSLAGALALVAVMWVIHFVLYSLDFDKSLLANIPRRREGLLGILTSPLVHDDFEHLISNSGPLFFFAAANFYFYPRSSGWVTLGVWLLSGIWVWLSAPTAAIIGASGVVYGLGAFLFFSGLVRRERSVLLLSLVIALFYSSMLAGVFPGKTGISWESHLFGALAGVAMAWGFRKVDVKPRKRYTWQDEPDEDPRDAQAPWNYRQNWSGANELYVPGTEDEPFSDH